MQLVVARKVTWDELAIVEKTGLSEDWKARVVTWGRYRLIIEERFMEKVENGDLVLVCRDDDHPALVQLSHSCLSSSRTTIWPAGEPGTRLNKLKIYPDSNALRYC